MHRALLSWELLGLVCSASYPGLTNPAITISTALTQAGISTAALRVGIGGLQCVHEPHCLNQLHLGPMLNSSA